MFLSREREEASPATRDPGHLEVKRMSKVKVTRPIGAVTENKSLEREGLRTLKFVYGWSTMIRIADMRGDLRDHGHQAALGGC